MRVTSGGSLTVCTSRGEEGRKGGAEEASPSRSPNLHLRREQGDATAEPQGPHEALTAPGLTWCCPARRRGPGGSSVPGGHSSPFVCGSREVDLTSALVGTWKPDVNV